MLHLKNSFFIILLGSLVFLSCYPQWHTEPGIIIFDTESFYREWAAWEAQGITSYSVEEDVLITSIRGEKAHIVVRDNAIIQNETLDRWDSHNVEDLPNYRREFFNEVRTISEIYAWVNRVYEEAVKQFDDGHGIMIKITYNNAFHYPKFVNINNTLVTFGCNLQLSKFIPASIPEE